MYAPPEPASSGPRRLVGIHASAASPARVAAALGQDAAGTWCGDGIALAWTGPAPYISDDLVCIVDGRLDGADRLGAALGVPAGATTEALLGAGYRRLGDRLLAELSGEFALVLWDRLRGRGIAARDQLGVRPLVWTRLAGEGIAFASEPRDLLRMLPARPAPDEAAVARWLALTSLPAGRTLHAGIRRLRPAHRLSFDRSGCAEGAYWTPRFEPALEGPREELVERVRHELDAAVARRLPASGPAAVLLSGGLDSPAVAALAAAHGPVRAYTAVFPEHPEVDESGAVDLVCRRLALPSVRVAVRSGGLLAGALRHQLTWGLPTPAWGDSYAAGLMAAARRDGAGAVLTGDGADELFGPRPELIADLLARGRAGSAAALVRRLPGAGDRPSRRAVLSVLAAQLPLALGRAPTPEPPVWLPAGLPPADDERSVPAGPRWWRSLARLLTEQIEATGFHDILRRDSIAAGVEGRAPFFDLRLVELALRLPPEFAFDPHLRKPQLRGALAGRLPESVLRTPRKTRFDGYLVDCLSGVDRASIRELLGPGARVGAYLDRDRLERELLDVTPSAYRAGRFAWALATWRTVTMECWLRAEEDALFAQDLLARCEPAASDLPLFSALTTPRIVPTLAVESLTNEGAPCRTTAPPRSATTAT